MKLLTLLVFLLVVPALAEDAPPNEKLCSIKTVFIEGHGRTANWFRKNLEKKSWLRIENVKPQADGILEVGGAGNTFFPLNVRLSRREPEEYLWDGNSRGFSFANSYNTVLNKLMKAANCPKP